MAGKTVWSLVNTCCTCSALEMSHDKVLYKSTVTLILILLQSCSVKDTNVHHIQHSKFAPTESECAKQPVIYIWYKTNAIDLVRLILHDNNMTRMESTGTCHFQTQWHQGQLETTTRAASCSFQVINLLFLVSSSNTQITKSAPRISSYVQPWRNQQVCIHRWQWCNLFIWHLWQLFPTTMCISVSADKSLLLWHHFLS